MMEQDKISKREQQLRNILAHIVAESDLKKVLDLILKNGVDFLNMDSGGIILYREAAPDKFSYYSAVNIPMPYVTRIIKEEGGLISQVISQKKLAILQDFTPDTPLAKMWHGLGFKVVIVAPLIYHDELFGLIHLSSTDPQRRINSFEEESIQIYAEYAGIVIYIAQMLEELKRHRTHLEELVAQRTIELEKMNAELQQEIVERKKTGEALKASEHKYKTLVENLPQKIFLKDRNSIYISCNDNYAKDLKIKSNEIAGKTDYDFYPQELAEKYRADDKRIMGAGNTEDIEEKYIQDGQGVIVHTVKTPVEDENGNTVGILGIFWDITERKKAEEALKNYTRQIEKVNKELDDFTYIVSHDLKEPLRSIDAFSKFVLDDYKDRLDEEGRNYLERIRINSSRMQNLIEDLLEISRIERKSGSFEELEAEELVNEARLRLEYGIKEKNAEIIVKDKLPKVFCDRVRLTEVFLNLISNALKFNDKPNPRIEIGANLKDVFYEFWVKDNGPGIEEQYFDKIFEIFQRLGKIEEHEGTGAGLTIAKKIVQMHKGKIWVESKLGEGSAFYFTIPKGKEAILGKKKIGEILVEKNLVTEEEVKKALEEQERRGE